MFVVADEILSVPFELLSFSPMLFNRAGASLDLLFGPAPRIIRRPRKPSHRCVKDQRRSTLRVSRREENAHWATLGVAEDRGTLGPYRVHNSAHILHPLL